MINIGPNEGPQTAFLSCQADIAIYGGAAGAGKTYALTLEPLRHYDNGSAGAVFFRRTSPEITNEGGLWDEAGKVYPLLNAVPKLAERRYVFPSGFRVSYRHLQHESTVYSYQSTQMPLILFDEITHFTRRQFFYMLTRNRSATAGFAPYVRAACNPDPDSFVAAMIEWWIDEAGYPIPERSGVIKWFLQVGDDLLWYDSRDEAVIGGQRLQLPAEAIMPISFTFIPAKVYDNPQLLRNDPNYLGRLLNQDLVTRERLLGGNWKIRPTAGKVFNRGWFEVVDAVPAGGAMVRFWDLASTKKELSKKDPDYSASMLVRYVNGISYIEDVTWCQETPGYVDKLMCNLARQDFIYAAQTGASYEKCWEQEGGASGPRETLRLVGMLAGVPCSGIRPQGDKLTRARAWASQALAGNVKVLNRPWVDYVLNHLHNQPDNAHDDIMDAGSGAHNRLYNGKVFQSSAGETQEVIARYHQQLATNSQSSGVYVPGALNVTERAKAALKLS